MKYATIAICAALLGGGCVQTLLIDHKTALERQVIGTYEDLGSEVLMLATVRAEPTAPPPELASAPADDGEPVTSDVLASGARGSSLFRSAVDARRVELFLRDDVDELLAGGCVIESDDGGLAAQSCPLDADADVGARIQRVVKRINEAREAVVAYIIFINTDLTPADRPQVLATLHRLKVRAREQRETQGS